MSRQTHGTFNRCRCRAGVFADASAIQPACPPAPTQLPLFSPPFTPQADDGFLYPLERAFFYVQKPPLLLVFDDIDSLEFMRQVGSPPARPQRMVVSWIAV